MSTVSARVDIASVLGMVDLLMEGTVQALNHTPDGAWTVVPASGGVRRFAGAEQAKAYVDLARNGYGVEALALADIRTAATAHASHRAARGN